MDTLKIVKHIIKKPFLTKQKRSKNWYIVTTNHVTKKRSFKSTGTDNRETAERLLRELEMSLGYTSKTGEQANKIKDIVLSGIKHTTGAIIQAETPLEMIWIEYQRNERTRVLQPDSLLANKHLLSSFISFLKEAGIQYTEQVTYELSKAYLDTLRSKGRADGTLANHRNGLNGIFARVKRGLNLPENPFADVEAPFRPKRKTHRCFTPEELKKLMSAVDVDWRMVIILAYFTGLRFGDCCRFELNFIKWDKNIIQITPRKTKRLNKELMIPLHPALKKAIQSYTNVLSGYLIPNFAELKNQNNSDFASTFRRILKGLGLSKYTTEGTLDFHSLRHTFNTNLANGDIDVSTRMKLTGHSSIEINQIYNHATEPLRKAIECLPVLE